MGTPEFAETALRKVVESGFNVVGVVTMPDKPMGRHGSVLQSSPVKKYAQSVNIPVLQPEKLKSPDFLQELADLKADIQIVVAFRMLPEQVWNMPPMGTFNLHASLLPQYRGAAPIQWAIIDGEEVTGVTTMQMNEGLDTGDMLLKTIVPIEAKETGGSLFDKLAAEGAKLCVETLEALENKTASWEPQGETPTAYARMLDKEIGNIKWEKTAVQIERLIRGLNPWPSAYTDWNGKVMKIWEADVVDKNNEAVPGTIVKVEKDGFYVQTGDGQIKVTALQIPGKKRMEADAFLRGYQIEEGTLLR